jgi:hypothetical protein
MTTPMSTTPTRWRRTLAQALNWTRDRPRRPTPAIEELRALCDALVADLEPVERRAVHRSLTQARDAQDVWHLRSHLFGLISLRHGEHVARERLQRLDAFWA